MNTFFMWAHKKTGKGGMVEIAYHERNVYFAVGVQKSIVPFALDCVKRLGLDDTPIVIMRGSQDGAFGNAFPTQESTVNKTVMYSRKLGLGDMMKVTHVNGETFFVNAIEVTLLHELLHIAFDDMSENWVSDKAFDILLNGWEVL